MGVLQKANRAFRNGQLGTAACWYEIAILKYPDINNSIHFNLWLTRKNALKARRQAYKNDSSTDKFLSNDFSMHILFVLPGPLDSNNGYHVQHYVHRLELLGVRCQVAVGDAFFVEREDIEVLSFSDVLESENIFSCDLIHAWTPREIVRKFVEQVRSKKKVPLAVHLEDNEEYLAEVIIGKAFGELKALSEDVLDDLVPENCYHPIRGRHFLDQAQGTSVIIKTLARFNSGPSLFVLPPPVDERLFHPRPLNEDLRSQLEIAQGTLVFAYTGNVHSGNVGEVGELYKAVAILNSQGMPSVLLRTGQDSKVLEVDWDRFHEIQLGWVKRARIPEILAAADVLVQPGESSPFNDQRIPSKLPEYFAMGRPVILPQTNLGMVVTHGRDAYVLQNADAHGIVRAVREICGNIELRDRLSRGARSFYEKELASDRVVPDLLRFYGNLVFDRHVSNQLAK